MIWNGQSRVKKKIDEGRKKFEDEMKHNIEKKCGMFVVKPICQSSEKFDMSKKCRFKEFSKVYQNRTTTTNREEEKGT